MGALAPLVGEVLGVERAQIEVGATNWIPAAEAVSVRWGVNGAISGNCDAISLPAHR
jgi:hypothetical protein